MWWKWVKKWNWNQKLIKNYSKFQYIWTENKEFEATRWDTSKQRHREESQEAEDYRKIKKKKEKQSLTENTIFLLWKINGKCKNSEQEIIFKKKKSKMR